MHKSFCCLISLLVLSISIARSQFLFEEHPIGIPANSVIEWGDYDNDGDQDLLYVSGGAIALLKNTLTGTTAAFSPSAITFPAYTYSTFGWFDINRDGYLDIYAITDSGIRFLISDKNNSFTEVTPNFNYTPANIFDWGDMDNDGLLDLFSGDIFRNKGNYEFERRTVLNLPSGEFFDYDSDGDLDVFSEDNVYQNLGSYVFDLFKYFNVDLEDGGATLFGMQGSMLQDVNGDGIPEYIGLRSAGSYLGCQRGDFRIIGVDLSIQKTFSLCALDRFVNAADYDHDGAIDYILQHYYTADFGPGYLEVYTINAAGELVTKYGWGFGGSGPSRNVDVNNDGNLDFSVGGSLIMNIVEGTGVKPLPPMLSDPILIGNNSVSISWSKGSDDKTPVNSLTYNLVVARGPEFSFSDGVSIEMRANRTAPGNVGYNLEHVLKGLSNGIYQCRVQSVDQGLRTSAFSSAATFEITDGDDAVAVTQISGEYKTVFNEKGNQYFLAYAQGGKLYGEFLDGRTAQRMSEPFVINSTSGATNEFNVGYHSTGNIYVVTWAVGNKLYGKSIQPSDFTGSGTEKVLYTAATAVDAFHLAGKHLLYAASRNKVFFPWMERRGTQITLKTAYLTAALNVSDLTTKVFDILQGEIYPDGQTSETIPLTFESDIDFVSSNKLYALAWTFNGSYFVPCPVGCAPGLVNGNYILESLKEDGTWLSTTTVVTTMAMAPTIKYNPFNDNLLCAYNNYIQEFSRDNGLSRFKEIKARLISLSSAGIVSYQGPTIDVSISTPPLKNLGNELPTVAWSSKRNEFIVGWSKTNFSTPDNFLFYQRINPFTGSLVEPTQTILTTESGHAAQLNYNSVSGNFLLGWLGAGAGNFKTFSTYQDPAPVLSQLSSTKAYAGTKITITGLNFGKTPFINSVMFGGTPAKVDTLFFDTKKLQVTVPPGLGRLIVPVTVTFDDQTSNAISFENISSTSVTSVTPLVGALGDIITITGINFPEEEDLVQVTFGSIASEPTDVISSAPTEIKVKVPQAALRGSNQVVNVVIQAVPNFGVSNFRVIRPPVIESVTVDGNEFISCKSVVISGHDLFAHEDDLTIKVGDVEVSQEDIIIASDDGLNFRIPLGAEGEVPITVITDDREGVSPATYKVWLGSKVSEATVNDDTTALEFIFTNRSDDFITFKAKVYNQCSVDEMKFWTKGISASDNDWKSIDLTSSLTDNRVEFPMTEANFTDDPIGLLAFYEVIDKSTKIKYSDTLEIYRNYTELDSSNVIPNLRFGGSVADYSIVALPYEFQVNKITTVFRDLFNDYGYDKSKWRIAHYENSKGDHVEYPQLDEIDPGKGYWLISRYPHDIYFEGAKTLNVDSGYYTITLGNGWNQIGNPFNFNVSWAEVLELNGKPTDVESFKTFKDGTWSESSTIDRFRGGFVKYNGNGTFPLKIPVRQNNGINGGRAEEDKPFPGDLSEKEWRIAIDLDAGPLKNKLTSFGMHPQSTDGEDERDEHRLPAFIETLDAVFPGSLSTSMVNTSDHHSWEFEVFNTTGTNEVALNWDNTLFGTNDRELYLHDKVEERLIDMRAQNSYTFVYNPGHSFAIHFGDAEYIKETSRPGHLTLATAYPNPMSTTTSIAFSLSRDYREVRLTVYDVRGKEVRKILQEPLEAGFYETRWEGNDENGTPLPNGLWIYRLQVVNGKKVESVVGKVVLRR